MNNESKNVRLLWFSSCRFFYNWSCVAIGERFEISEKTVRRWTKRFVAGSDRLTTDGRKGKAQYRNAKLKQEHHTFLIHLLTWRSDLYLDEFSDAILEHFHIRVSLSTICRALQSLGYTRKVVRGPSSHAWVPL